MKSITVHFLLSIVMLCSSLSAQGPNSSYYYKPATELEWAECTLFLDGGSQQKIPFLPVINGDDFSVFGTGGYLNNAAVDGTIVFIGSGIVRGSDQNSYLGKLADYSTSEIDVTGKIVMFCYDLPDNYAASSETIPTRIAEASKRGAAAVVLFSLSEPYPFLRITPDPVLERDIPIITISRESAENILESAGLNGKQMISDFQKTGIVESWEMITKLKLRIIGAFEFHSSSNFDYYFFPEKYSEYPISQIIELNEKSLRFIRSVFDDERYTWAKMSSYLFPGYDAKLFYTRHRGTGLASGNSVFLVQKDTPPELGLLVHENMHIFLYQNWGSSSSFIDEGIAKQMEALATDININHRITADFLRRSELFPLADLIPHSIGFPGKKTVVGYPASGSFIAFMIDRFGLNKLEEIYILEGKNFDAEAPGRNWATVYGTPLIKLESEWHTWIKENFAGNR